MGQSPPSSAYNTTGQGLPFFQGKADFGDLFPRIRTYCTEPTRVAEAGDILISVRAPVGPTNLCPTKSCIGRGLAAIRPKPGTDQKYLLYFLRFHESALAAEGQGSTFDAVSRDDLEDVSVPLPPLPEQQRLAALLDKADHLRRTRRYAQHFSDTFLQSVFLEMFGDTNSNEKGWDVEPLENKITYMTSGSRGWAQFYSQFGSLFLRIQNVGKNEMLLNDVAYVQPPDTAEGQRTQVRPGDLLISITADLGRTVVIPAAFPVAYINQHLALLRLKDINPLFVSAYIQSPGGKAALLAADRGGVKAGLNFDDLQGLNIPIPPLALQEQFAAVVRRTERLRGQQREAARQAEHLFQTLLARAFRGEV